MLHSSLFFSFFIARKKRVLIARNISINSRNKRRVARTKNILRFFRNNTSASEDEREIMRMCVCVCVISRTMLRHGYGYAVFIISVCIVYIYKQKCDCTFP